MTSATSDEFTEVKLSCACHQLTASMDVPTSALPLKLVLCHCDTCRHASGVLCCAVPRLPEDVKSLQVRGKAELYYTSKDSARCLCFCGVCGTHVYENAPVPSKVGLCSGALEKADGIVELDSHIFVADTKDGGLREWLPDVPAWEGWYDGRSKEIGRGLAHSKPTPSASVTSDALLHAHCHCGGVQFNITRLEPKQFPEYSSSGELWVGAREGKYTACVCACNSCRLGTGYDLQAWAYVPKCNIRQTNGEPFEFDMGTLKTYVISKGYYRDFCGICGATVFWRSDKRRATQSYFVDIGVGLFESTRGARAEDWLVWDKEISYLELAQKKALLKSLAKGIEHWAEQKDKKQS